YTRGRFGSRRDQGKSTGARAWASVQGPVWWKWGGRGRAGNSRAAGRCAVWAGPENIPLKPRIAGSPHARRCWLIVPTTPEKIHSLALLPTQFRSWAQRPTRWDHGRVTGETLASRLTGRAAATLTNGSLRCSATVPPAGSI